MRIGPTFGIIPDEGFDPASLSGWSFRFDAAKGTTLISNRLSQWVDQGPDANVFTQATAGSRLTLTAADAAYNNQPTLSCTAGDPDFISGALATTVPSTATQILVGQINNGGGPQMTDQSTGGFGQSIWGPGGVWGAFGDSGAGVSTAVADNAPAIVIVTFSPTTVTMYVNSKTAAVSGNGGSAAMTSFIIGAGTGHGNPATGKVALVGCLNRTLTAAEIAATMLAYGARFGIATT